MIKVLELFGGIGACTAALKRLHIPYEVVDYVEIDKFAVKSYNAINETDFEVQDVTRWDKDIEVDLIMHGSPCQDFSIAGKQAGGDEGSGTRSSLMYETVRIIEKLKPKYVIWENVKNVLSKKHKHNFDNYINALEELGYKNYHKVLDAQVYGIPQHRERIFVVSIRTDIYREFKFPEGKPLDKRLRDVLESQVDDKFYLSDKAIKGFTKHKERNTEKGNGFGWNPTDGSGVANALQTTPCKSNGNSIKQVGQLYGTDNEPNPSGGRVYSDKGVMRALGSGHGVSQPLVLDDTNLGFSSEPRVFKEVAPTLRAGRSGLKVAIPQATKKGYIECEVGGVADLSYPESKARKGRVQSGGNISPTITAESNGICRIEAAAIGGRYTDDGTTKQQLEVSGGESANAITTVQKDSIIVEHKEPMLRIRKLTPLECWRLMGFSDEDFHKAEAVNSNTQLYKQAGNSIVVDVLCGIFQNLLIVSHPIIATQTGWTPCSENLPDKAGMSVLLTVRKKGIYGKSETIQAFSGYGNQKARFYTNLAGHDFRDMEVLAWMPLPEPYKEESKE